MYDIHGDKGQKGEYLFQSVVPNPRRYGLGKAKGHVYGEDKGGQQHNDFQADQDQGQPIGAGGIGAYHFQDLGNIPQAKVGLGHKAQTADHAAENPDDIPKQCRKELGAQELCGSDRQGKHKVAFISQQVFLKAIDGGDQRYYHGPNGNCQKDQGKSAADHGFDRHKDIGQDRRGDHH